MSQLNKFVAGNLIFPTTYLTSDIFVLEIPTSWIRNQMRFLDAAIAARTNDKSGIVVEALLLNKVSSHTARVEADADVENAVKIVQVALKTQPYLYAY